ncbi:MAG TPA: hypothetical protein VGD64_13940 [Acidisarcina sp.]
MNRRLARLLVGLYPRGWRARYGDEFEALLLDRPGGLEAVANVFWAAFCEHIFPTQGGAMHREAVSFGSVMKQPSAYLPLAMSVTALALVLLHVARYGAMHEVDEGPTAHLWQLLMVLQAPVIVVFAVKWLRRAPRQALLVLAQHVGAALASVGAVFFFNLG